MFHLWRIFILLTLCGFVTSDKSAANVVSAVFDSNKTSVHIVPGRKQGAIAWASFQDSIQQEGWSYLEIRTNPKVEDEVAAYSAGALEGALSRDMIKNHFVNTFANYCINNVEYCAKVLDYFSEQLTWMNERAQEERYRSPFWNQVYLILKQLAGLEDAYNNRTLLPVNNYSVVTWIYFLNNEGALYDLESAFGRHPDNGSINLVSPCSLLVKITDDDLLLGHNTWTSYRSMLRVLKKYMFKYQLTHGSDGRVPGHTISMSSYPGKLKSLDDFYIVSSGLAVSETTNDILNKTLYGFMKSTSVPTGFRAMVANRLAEDGRHWTRMFEKHNSGTYNNQWVVIDYKKVNATPNGVQFANETFWMLEQLPTLVVSRDMTDVLRSQGYWASYNIPYFSGIYKESGYEAKFLEHGNRYSHDNCSRAKIFMRDEFRVADPASMLTMLRYNDYTKDPLSVCNCTPPYSPVYTIAARYDLLEDNGHYDDDDLKLKAAGAIDVKVADSRSIRDYSFNAVCGPTNDVQPTFSWAKSKFNFNPVGHPDVFDFKPVRHRWSL